MSQPEERTEEAPETLAGEILGVMEAHTLTSRRQGISLDRCACGWNGYPHQDHRRLELYTYLLKRYMSAETERMEP